MTCRVKIYAPLTALFIGLFLFPLDNTPAARPGAANLPPSTSLDRPQAPGDIADWSMIVFQSTRDGNTELYRARGDGTQPIRITYDRNVDEMNPALNRGATQIIYEAEVNGNLDLYRVNIDGSGMVRLTTNKSPDYDAAWSPDSSKIAFVSERDGNAEIYVMNADGTGQTRLTSNRLTDVSPSWSPRGDLIAFIEKDNPIRGDVWMMKADGSVQAAVTSNRSAYIDNVFWSPNGTFLAFDGDTELDGIIEISSVDLIYGQFYLLYKNWTPGVEIHLDGWSPDSKWVTFTYVEQNSGSSYSEMVPQEFGNDPSVRMPGSGHDFAFSWNIADILPPVTALIPLPPYSPAFGFPLVLMGYDPGPAGIAGCQVAYRTQNQWFILPLFTQPTEYNFVGDPGKTYYFRSRAFDDAGNYEAWHPGDQGETQTTLYSLVLDGQVTDNRQQPLPNTSLTLTPTSLNLLKTNAGGEYQAYLAATDEYNLRINKTGYSAFIPTPLQIYLDSRFNLYLPPEDNLLHNGSFESGLAGWSLNGPISITGTSSVAHNGIKSLPLGHLCAPQCFNPLEEFTNNPSKYKLVIDRDGGIHIELIQGF